VYKDQTLILRQELLRNKPKLTPGNIGDSILIDKQVAEISKLKRYYTGAIHNNVFSENEAREIFGNENDSLYNHVSFEASVWKSSDFPGLKVALFDERKYTMGYTNAKSNKVWLGAFDVRQISQPLILPNKKYALIAWNSDHYGTMCLFIKKIIVHGNFIKSMVL
jgi:hypothetical protein